MDTFAFLLEKLKHRGCTMMCCKLHEGVKATLKYFPPPWAKELMKGSLPTTLSDRLPTAPPAFLGTQFLPLAECTQGLALKCALCVVIVSKGNQTHACITPCSVLVRHVLSLIQPLCICRNILSQQPLCPKKSLDQTVIPSLCELRSGGVVSSLSM